MRAAPAPARVHRAPAPLSAIAQDEADDMRARMAAAAVIGGGIGVTLGTVFALFFIC